jgi:hypothetical protein
MIGQDVNSPAQKLLRSARRKRGALQGVKCLVAVIQASWVSHGAWPQIKMQEHKTARMTQEQILEGSRMRCRFENKKDHGTNGG